MNPTCDFCGGWIEADNRNHPGYCSPTCRDAARSGARPAHFDERKRMTDVPRTELDELLDARGSKPLRRLVRESLVQKLHSLPPVDQDGHEVKRVVDVVDVTGGDAA